MTLSTSLKKYLSNGSHKSSSDIPSATGHRIARTSSAMSKNDPLYEPDESETADASSPPPSANTTTANANASTGSNSFSTLNKSLPNDIQRQQRNQPGKKLPSSINKLSVVSPSSSSSSAPAPASKHACTSPLNKNLTGGISMSSNNSTSSNINISSNISSNNNNLNPNFSFHRPFGGPSSPVDIFERNVQNADLSTDLSNSPLNTNSNFDTSTNNSTLNDDLISSGARPHSQPQPQPPSHSSSRSHSRSQSFTNLNNSYILSSCRPRHLISENYTSPVLDSTVELISSEKFDDTDVVEVPHARASQQLFKSHSHVSNASFSGSSSPRHSISRKYSNPANNGLSKNQTNLEHLQTSFSHNRSKSSLSNVSSPLFKTKSESHCTCNNNHNNNNLNNPLNADSTLVSPQRKSISFYSYLDLLNYERMSSGNNKNYTSSTSPSPPTYNNDFLTRQSDMYDAQEEAEDLRDLNNAQLLENQLTSDLLSINCPKHGIVARRMAHQGCAEDGDARIDEELNINKPKNSKNSYANNSEIKSSVSSTPIYSVFGSSSAVDNDQNNQNLEDEEEEDEQDGSIQSWVPEDNNFNNENSRTGSRRQSIVEEMASLKSCTTNNSYFEDELEECSTHDAGSKVGVPVVNVCSANDYLSSRTRELRNSFVCNDPSMTPKKIF